MKLGKSIISILILILIISTANAQYTAPGSAGATILNGVDVTIGGSGTFTFASLELKAFATLTIPSGVTVVVNGPFENKAGSTVIVDGELVLNGDANENKGGGAITGSGTLTAPNGIENRGGGTVFGSTDPNPSCTSGCSASTLPVELLHFDAEFKEKVILTWSTATEINNDYFSLERSEDGIDFYEIAQINGHGNTTEVIEYAYEDDTYEASVEYYRLNQVDYDGQNEIFKAVRVETNAGNAGNQFNIFPTVVSQGKVTIQGEKPFQVKDIQLFSLSGTSNNSYHPHSSETGSQEVEVNMGGLGNGLYLIKMISEAGDELTSRIVIQ